MERPFLSRVAFAFCGLVASALLAACGGGGGGSAFPSQGGRSGSAASFTGHLYQMGPNNAQTSTPIAGATIVISHTLYTGATPPPSTTLTGDGACSATTATDGSYTCSGAATGDGQFYVMVSAGAGYPTLHGLAYPLTLSDAPAGYNGKTQAVAGANTLRDLYLTPSDTTTTAWIAGINSENASFNPAAGANANLVLDEDLVEADVHWAQYMAAHNWFSHVCPTSPADPTCLSDQQYYETLSPAGQSEAGNIGDGYATWNAFQQAVVNEQSVCSDPVSSISCPSGDPPTGAGHLKTQLSPTNMWVGAATTTSAPSAPGGPWYDTGFVSATYNSQL